MHVCLSFSCALSSAGAARGCANNREFFLPFPAMKFELSHAFSARELHADLLLREGPKKMQNRKREREKNTRMNAGSEMESSARNVERNPKHIESEMRSSKANESAMKTCTLCSVTLKQWKEGTESRAGKWGKRSLNFPLCCDLKKRERERVLWERRILLHSALVDRLQSQWIL